MAVNRAAFTLMVPLHATHTHAMSARECMVMKWYELSVPATPTTANTYAGIVYISDGTISVVPLSELVILNP